MRDRGRIIKFKQLIQVSESDIVIYKYQNVTSRRYYLSSNGYHVQLPNVI